MPSTRQNRGPSAPNLASVAHALGRRPRALVSRTRDPRAAFEDAYGRWLDACGDPAEGFANFRRVRIPRVHGVQRLSFSNARFKHMRDATAQKQSIAAGTGSVHGDSEWVWGYDPVGEWDKEPVVPSAYAA
jgi:salicylate hydroxylase